MQKERNIKNDTRFAGRRGMISLVAVVALAVFGIFGTIDQFRSAEAERREAEARRAAADSLEDSQTLAEQAVELARLKHIVDSLMIANGETEK